MKRTDFMRQNPAKETQYKWLIGIDCGVKTGFCVYSKWDKRIRKIDTVKIHVAMEAVKNWHQQNPGEVLVRVEDARQATFGRQLDFNKAQGAGSIKRDAKIWEDYLEDIGVDYEMVRPNKKTTKWTAEAFKKVTGHSESGNEHARDAAMIVFGF